MDDILFVPHIISQKVLPVLITTYYGYCVKAKIKNLKQTMLTLFYSNYIFSCDVTFTLDNLSMGQSKVKNKYIYGGFLKLSQFRWVTHALPSACNYRYGNSSLQCVERSLLPKSPKFLQQPISNCYD